MNTDDDSDMVLREPVGVYMVDPKPAEVVAAHARPVAHTPLRGGQSVVGDMNEFTEGMMRAFGEAKDKAIRENNQLKTGQ